VPLLVGYRCSSPAQVALGELLGSLVAVGARLIEDRQHVRHQQRLAEPVAGRLLGARRVAHVRTRDQRASRRGRKPSDLAKALTRHASAFARDLGWDRKPKLDSLWANLLKSSGHHSGHIHPHSILSGTFYVEVPRGSGAIRFEDPRLPLMMSAPPRPDTFVAVEPRPGLLLLWESWLRHEVLPGSGKGERLSISFNFA
jgi:uncharacterized protein (TIGR02466 family)